MVRSAIETVNQRFFDATMKRLSQATKTRLDALLNTDRVVDSPTEDAEETTIVRSALYELKRGPGAVKLDSLLAEIAKLKMIDDLELPKDLFSDLAQGAGKLLSTDRRRRAERDPTPP